MNLSIASIISIVLIVLAGAVVFLIKQNESLKIRNTELLTNSKSMEYGLKAYKDKHNKEHAVSIEQIKTVKELNHSEDSIHRKLLADLNAAKIKLKDVKQLGYVKTEIIRDTSIVYVDRDTTYDLSQRPHFVEIIKVQNGVLSRNLAIFNEQSLIYKIKRETVNPPKKFFVARWLQKRHDVTYVDIVNSNTLIKTTGQKFIIVK